MMLLLVYFILFKRPFIDSDKKTSNFGIFHKHYLKCTNEFYFYLYSYRHFL